MSRDIISVELDSHHGRVPAWESALSRHIGQVPEALRNEEVTECVPAAKAAFRARLEYGAFGDALLFRTSATPNRFSRALRSPCSSLPAPLLLIAQVTGSHRFQQAQSFVLRPGDWCILDTLEPINCWTTSENAALLGLTLGRPADPELKSLLAQGSARRLDGTLGTSRILQGMMTELFHQMNNVAPSSGAGLCSCLNIMAFDALREQIASPTPLLYGDIQASRLKSYIESQLHDPLLSVAAVARDCGVSVRTVHRIFAQRRAGSVSGYIWRRRLERCAEALLNPSHERQSISEICLSWGFRNTSHFTRAFTEQFGISPRAYRSVQSAGTERETRSALHD